MSFLLVGDNRESGNWGGRAGSIAFFELLSGSLGSGRSVTNLELMLESADYGYIPGILPRGDYGRLRAIASGEKSHPVWKAAGWLDRRFGGHDFLTGDPEQSVRNLIRDKEKDEGLADLYRRIEEAEVVVVNGEGDVVMGRRVRRQIRFFLAVMLLARHLGKKVVFANAMLSDCSLTGRDPETFAQVASALKQADLVSLRDPVSFAMATHEMGVQGAHLAPDSLFFWYDAQAEARQQLPARGDFVVPHPEYERYLHRLDFGSDYICVGGNSLVTSPGQTDRVVAGYRRLIAGLQTLGLPVYAAVTDGPDRFLEDIAREQDLGIIPVGTPVHLASAILGRARLFVSGRYHPSIMAAMGGTPSVFLGTNAHKMQSLTRLLGYVEEPVFGPDLEDDDLAHFMTLARERLQEGQPLRDRIQAAAHDCSRRTAALGPMIAELLKPTQPAAGIAGAQE